MRKEVKLGQDAELQERLVKVFSFLRWKSLCAFSDVWCILSYSSGALSGRDKSCVVYSRTQAGGLFLWKRRMRRMLCALADEFHRVGDINWGIPSLTSKLIIRWKSSISHYFYPAVVKYHRISQKALWFIFYPIIHEKPLSRIASWWEEAKQIF